MTYLRTPHLATTVCLKGETQPPVRLSGSSVRRHLSRSERVAAVDALSRSPPIEGVPATTAVACTRPRTLFDRSCATSLFLAGLATRSASCGW